MCQIQNSTHRQNFLNTKHVSKMNMFASFSNHVSRKMSNALPVLVNALPTTLQISSRASTYRSCFEHFPFFTRSFSHHNTQRPKASACQKPFLFSCLQCHLHQSLQRAWKRLQSLCSPAFCGVRFEKSFYQEKCHKKFPSEPHQVLCFTMDTFLECWMFPLQALTGWSLWQLWWSLSSTLHLMPRFPLPVLSCYPHSQGPCALNCSAELRAAARGSLSLLGLCWGDALHGRDRLSLQTPLVTTSQPDWQADTSANTAAVIGLCRKYLSFKCSLFWFDSETDTRPCAPEFIGWRTSRQWKAKLKKK